MCQSPATCCGTEKCNTHYSGRSGAAPGERPPSCGQTGGFSAADLRPQHLPRDLQTQHHGPAVGKSLSHTHRISQTQHYELADLVILFFIIFFLSSSLPLSTSLWLQDLFFKYTWNNFLHLQVELCVASILNHSAHVDLQNPGLQNHEERPATGTGSQAEEGTPGQNNTSDPANTPIQDALVANVGHLL